MSENSNNITPTSPQTATFDELTKAAGKFLAEIADRAHREQPQLYVAIDEALKSGESYTSVTIKIFAAGISIKATINKISNGEEQALLQQVDGASMVLQ